MISTSCRFVVLTLTLLVAASVPAMVQSADPAPWPALEWKVATPTPFARVESPVAVVDGKFYLFGGFTEDLQASNQVDVYDPVADSWARKKDMPTRLTHLNPAIDGKAIWFAGGFKGKHPGPVSDEVWKYDVATDSWVAGPSLPEPRAGGGLEVLGRKLHYFGGYKIDRDTNPGDHWSLSLDGGKVWQREAELPDPRGHVSVVVLEEQMYALGGCHGHDKTQIDVSSCHRFNPADGKWHEIAKLPDGRSHFESSTFVHRGRIVIVGGRCNSSAPPRNVVDDLLEYDPKTDQWRVVAQMPEKVMAPAAAIIGNHIIVTGGGLNNPRPLTAVTRVAPLPAGSADDNGKVDVFLAAGKLGRTVMSIDDGVSWIHDRSDDDSARCWCEKTDPHYVECDHDPRSFTGLDVSADGWFYAQYGWGALGTVRRSRNFRDWEVVRTEGWGGGLAVANSAVVSLWNGRRWRSVDHGKTWDEVKDSLDWGGHPFVKSVGETLFAVGREDGQFKISQDAGQSWKLLPDVRAGWSDSIVVGNGILVSAGTRRLKDQPTIACTARSTDGGLTWTGQELLPGKSWAANVVFNGKEFVNWSEGQQYRSPDGVTWTATPMTTGSFNTKHWNASVCVNPRTGTYVAVLNVWGNFYEKQKAYRSKDGITWTELTADHFTGGHPIGRIILARMNRDAVAK